MHTFTKEDIDKARFYFRNQNFQEVDTTLGNRRFNYFVLPQSMEPKLLNFVMRMTGKLEDGYVLGISDNVDSKYRAYAVAHEYIEFMEIGIDTPDRCVKALEEELKLVPENILPEYVAMRAKFFRDLIAFCTAQPKYYTKEDLTQFQRNALKLEKILK